MDPRRVRKQVDRMGIPTNMPLSEVIIVGKDVIELVQGGPLFQS